jgi:hypothetical protein
MRSVDSSILRRHGGCIVQRKPINCQLLLLLIDSDGETSLAMFLNCVRATETP